MEATNPDVFTFLDYESTVHQDTTNAQRHAWKTSLEDSTYFPCYQSAVWSGKCRVWSGVESVECGVWSVK